MSTRPQLPSPAQRHSSFDTARQVWGEWSRKRKILAIAIAVFAVFAFIGALLPDTSDETATTTPQATVTVTETTEAPAAVKPKPAATTEAPAVVKPKPEPTEFRLARANT